MIEQMRYEIKLQMEDYGLVPSGIRIKQNDKGAVIHFAIYKDGEIYNPTDAQISVMFRRADGVCVPASITSGDCVVTGAVTARPGMLYADIKIVDGEPATVRESSQTVSLYIVEDTQTEYVDSGLHSVDDVKKLVDEMDAKAEQYDIETMHEDIAELKETMPFISEDDGNMLVEGTDGGWYTSGGSGGASSWTELTNKPFESIDDETLKSTNDVLEVGISSDADNALEKGTDGGLYVEKVTGGASTAEQVSYDDTTTQIGSDNVQGVIEKLNIQKITQAEYDELTEEEQNSNNYLITDSGVNYDLADMAVRKIVGREGWNKLVVSNNTTATTANFTYTKGAYIGYAFEIWLFGKDRAGTLFISDEEMDSLAINEYFCLSYSSNLAVFKKLSATTFCIYGSSNNVYGGVWGINNKVTTSIAPPTTSVEQLADRITLHRIGNTRILNFNDATVGNIIGITLDVKDRPIESARGSGFRATSNSQYICFVKAVLNTTGKVDIYICGSVNTTTSWSKETTSANYITATITYTV